MPSPFPGMDPFIEHPDVWPDFHATFIQCVRDEIRPQLPPGYYAAVECREYVTIADREVVPDLNIRRKGKSGDPAELTSMPSGTMVTEAVVVPIPREFHREWFITIRENASHEHAPVTTLELLSPSNKKLGSKGRRLFRRKQREMISSRVNLVEIDLLRGGEHVTSVPLHLLKQRTAHFDYHVCILRAFERGHCLAYPFGLRDKLPSIPVPLREQAPPIPIRLQAAMDLAYDRCSLAIRDLYFDPKDLNPPLAQDDLRWVKQVLRKKGLIPPR